ncbi:hypothetical protein HPP92_002187 [Vanilla planifolia]|uniref:Patatin n=1 Tax=Vanilla planifolia TaxID=51239 RepID=A0A835RSI1_VANPL|nr:hypothetical protein HPP92_002187 [Vanilla planifolia]
MFWKPGGHLPLSSMASHGFSFPILLQETHLSHSPRGDPIPRPRLHFSSARPRTFSYRVRASGERKSNPSPPPELLEKKSFAVATGELFLGLASSLLKNRKSSGGVVSVPESGQELLGDPGEEDLDAGRGERVESVLEEAVIWEQRPEDLEAERERKIVTSPGFSFSAAGLLFPYHLGVAKHLLEKGYIKESTPLAGSSAGSIVCAVIASGCSMEVALQATKILAEDCRLKGTAFRLGAVLRDVLNEFLPDDVHRMSNGRVRVAITQLSWRPRGLLIDQFDSKEDVINAVITSSFIPGYLAPSPATIYRNRLCVDGGLTLFMPPTSASKTVQFVLSRQKEWD